MILLKVLPIKMSQEGKATGKVSRGNKVRIVIQLSVFAEF